MDPEIKQILSKVVNVLVKDKSLYFEYPRNVGRDRDKFTAQGLADASGNHLLDDRPELFNISKLQALKVRSYFFKYANENHVYINELYKEFPAVFEGESREYIDDVTKLDKDVPLF